MLYLLAGTNRLSLRQGDLKCPGRTRIRSASLHSGTHPYVRHASSSANFSSMPLHPEQNSLRQPPIEDTAAAFRKLPDEVAYRNQPFFIRFLHRNIDGQGLGCSSASDRSNLTRDNSNILLTLVQLTRDGHDFSFFDFFGRLRERVTPDHDFDQSCKIFNGHDRERLSTVSQWEVQPRQ
jgi:hypothetical protein